MKTLNNWEDEKVIKKDDIIEFEFLYENGLIKEIEEEYYCLNGTLYNVEKKFYEENNMMMADKLGLRDVQKEIDCFIKKLNKYNEVKDIAQSLMGKIAEIKGVTIKDIHTEMEMSILEE